MGDCLVCGRRVVFYSRVYNKMDLLHNKKEIVMEQYIPKDVLVAEIKARISDIEVSQKAGLIKKRDADKKILIFKSIHSLINTLEVKEVDLEDYNKVKKVLSLSFMQFLDSYRQEGKMCLSNGECFDIDKAFDELDFAKLFRYMEKYLKAQKGEYL